MAGGHQTPPFLTNLGSAYLATGKLSEAKQTLSAALASLHPTPALPYGLSFGFALVVARYVLNSPMS